MYGVVLILVLVLTGGAIAFIGDRLGSKVGKKKMRIFGLRPKHTSVLVTIVTGILITTMTLGVMSIMSENVRTALFGMEQLNANMAKAQSELVEATADLAMAKAEQDKIQAELTSTKKELSGLEEQKNVLEKRTQELQDTNSKLETSNQLLTDNNLELMEKSDKLTRINNILEEGNERLKQNNEELYQVNRELTTGIQIMREGSIAFQAGETLSGGVIKGNISHEEAVYDLNQLLNMARQNIDLRQGNSAPGSSQDELLIYQQEFDEAARYISSHEGEFVVRIVAAGNLIQGEAVPVNLQLFANHTVFETGELITDKRVTFNPADNAELEGVLTGFLTEVHNKALDKGMISDTVRNSVGVVNSEEIYSLLEQMQKSSGRGIISAFAEGATDIVGPLRIKLKFLGTGLLP